VPTVIETERLILREFTWDDLDVLTALYADPEVMRYYRAMDPAERARNTIERALKSYEENGFAAWAMIPRSTGRFIGRCGLLVWEFEEGREVEVGYVLAKEYWHQGYATEAARAVRDWAFEHTDVPRVISLIHPDNQASIRVAERYGAHYTCTRQIGELTAKVYVLDRPDATRSAE
jgi:[ribosomal protein S5]-alanine N-acetyltransferase